MRKLIFIMAILVFTTVFFMPYDTNAAHVNSIKIVYLDLASPGKWSVNLYSTEHMNNVLIQASQSVYLPGQAQFAGDLSPASGFNTTLPGKGEVVKTTTWNKRSGAKTFVLTITYQGQERKRIVDLRKPYACKVENSQHPNIKLNLMSISISPNGSTYRFKIIMNNKTKDFHNMRLSPWLRGPNGDKMTTINYAKNFYPERVTEVSYSITAFKGITEIGLTYGPYPGPLNELGHRVVCRSNGKFKIQDSLNIKKLPVRSKTGSRQKVLQKK
jgi:hypothetical protein